MSLKLHSYFRSSASYRVRIGLALKELPYQIAPVHLLRGGGEQRTEPFRTLNPMQLVPVLEDGELVISQSLAILEYLEERYTRLPLRTSQAELA